MITVGFANLNRAALIELAVPRFRKTRKKASRMAAAMCWATETQADATNWLGIKESEFGRMRTRLGQLAKCFLSGEPVPRQRKPYKKRIARTNQFSGSHPHWTQQVKRLA